MKKTRLKKFKSKCRILLLGTDTFLENKYERLYGTFDCEARIKETRKAILNKYYLAIAIFLALMLITVVSEASQTVDLEKTGSGKSVYVVRPAKGEGPVVFDAKMTVCTKNGLVDKDVQVIIEAREEKKEKESFNAEQEKETPKEKLENEMKTAVRSINSDTSTAAAVLPNKLAGGEKVSWETASQSNIPMLIIVFIVVAALIFRMRFDGIAKEEKAAKESIIRELPEFINKIVLLLNAGVVMNTAFVTVMEDKEKVSVDRNSYFYGQLHHIYIKVSHANASINGEFREFAKRSGVRELMRLSNIINDNIKKGSDLVEKLQRESELLWFARKKQSEEKGRIAETKLTFPLVILLLVLVMVTIAPAMLEM